MRLDDELAAHISALTETVAGSAEVTAAIVDRLCHCFAAGGKLLLAGNGGSAADAQHIAGEFVNRLAFDRPALAAIALSTDSSVLTCVANDACYEQVFARQVEALARPGDVLVGLTTSGRSGNIVEALACARRAEVVTIAFTGRAGGRLLAPACDHVVAVATDDCVLIQEAHEFLWHRIVAAIEARLFGAVRA
jgi:D-sedoheptulose 7-phosphate isomerase